MKILSMLFNKDFQRCKKVEKVTMSRMNVYNIDNNITKEDENFDFYR